MDWTELGRQRYQQGSTAPAPALISAHSRQQITNVETISGRTAVLPLTWTPTSREQLASCFIVPPPCSTAQSICIHQLPLLCLFSCAISLQAFSLCLPPLHSTLHSLCHFPLAPTFLDVPAENIQRTALPTGKILITILPVHSSFLPCRAYSITNRLQSTLL